MIHCEFCTNSPFCNLSSKGKPLLMCKDNIEKTIDWEQRRYEIAKDVLITLIAYPTRTHNNFYDEAINFADNLIEKLKQK